MTTEYTNELNDLDNHIIDVTNPLKNRKKQLMLIGY